MTRRGGAARILTRSSSRKSSGGRTSARWSRSTTTHRGNKRGSTNCWCASWVKGGPGEPAPSSGEGSLIEPRAGPEEKEEKGAPQLRRQRRPPKRVSSRTPLPNRVRTPRRLSPLPQRLAPALRRPLRGSGHPHGGLRGGSVEAECASGAATGGRRTLRSAEHAQRTAGGARGQGRSREHAAIGDCVSLASPGPQLRPPET